jgi:hypothetical protein
MPVTKKRDRGLLQNSFPNSNHSGLGDFICPCHSGEIIQAKGTSQEEQRLQVPRAFLLSGNESGNSEDADAVINF